MTTKTILLVEDNADDEALTIRAFQKNNIANPIHVVRDGAEALDYLFSRGEYEGKPLPNVSLVLLDLNLPKLNGWEVLRRIRDDASTRLLSVVVLTSSKEEEDITRSYSLGANSYVRKPVDFSQFIDAVKQLGLYWLVLNVEPPITLHPGGAGMKALQLLMVEDSDDDAELTVRQLRRAGREVELTRVDTPDAFDHALAARSWDVILCDHSMPKFSGAEALRRFRAAQLDTPFIILSGTIGEENAVAAMKQGASDYILKGNLARLPGAIERELAEARIRREHRAASEALAQSEAHLRTLLDAAADGVLTVDEAGRVQLFNPAAEKMFGIHEEDVRGTPIETLLGSWREMVHAGGRHDSVAKRSDGHFFSAQVAISEMTVKGHRTFLALVRDVTEQHESEARLRQLATENETLYHQAQRAVALRDEFLAVASHELRTPLTPLSLKLQYLQRLATARSLTPLGSTSVQDAISMAQRQMLRITRLVTGLLDVSRISSGRLQLDITEVDLAQVAREALEQVTQDGNQAGCTLHFESGGVTQGHWDRLRLEQVVINLLTNAIKYGAGHPVWVEVHGDGTKATLTVRDEGIGVETKDLSRIFDKFERGVSDRHYGGLGLGLYITREIVQALQGKIRCESHPGRGATFTIELPQDSVGARPSERLN